MNEYGTVEPPAQLRQASRELFLMFVALMKEGFTEAQAIAIIGAVLSSQNGNGS